jgi:hypothetical protein
MITNLMKYSYMNGLTASTSFSSSRFAFDGVTSEGKILFECLQSLEVYQEISMNRIESHLNSLFRTRQEGFFLLRLYRKSIQRIDIS